MIFAVWSLSAEREVVCRIKDAHIRLFKPLLLAVTADTGDKLVLSSVLCVELLLQWIVEGLLDSCLKNLPVMTVCVKILEKILHGNTSSRKKYQSRESVAVKAGYSEPTFVGTPVCSPHYRWGS